jgi:hypothetical protein
MAVPFWTQVRAVLWKNWLLKRKSPFSTFFEVCCVCVWDRVCWSRPIRSIDRSIATPRDPTNRRRPPPRHAQVAIPVLFIGLLVWIKSICTKIDAPSVAYACGQTAGFEGFYTDSLRDYARNLSGVPLLQCLQPPDGWCVRVASPFIEMRMFQAPPTEPSAQKSASDHNRFA